MDWVACARLLLAGRGGLRGVQARPRLAGRRGQADMISTDNLPPCAGARLLLAGRGGLEGVQVGRRLRLRRRAARLLLQAREEGEHAAQQAQRLLGRLGRAALLWSTGKLKKIKPTKSTQSIFPLAQAQL